MASLEQNSGANDLGESGGEEHAEYESDSEEGTSALALRRRVASDDEEDDEAANNGNGYHGQDVEHREATPPVEDYNEEEEEEEEEEEDGEEFEDEGTLVFSGRSKNMNEDHGDEDGGVEGSNQLREDERKGQISVGNASKEGVTEEKKDAEPFVVPTAGAFYMHDDRFRYNGIARPRRSAGGRKLWEAKDEKPWVHDRFEEMKLNDESYPGQGVRGRRGRGRQGRVQGRGKDPGHARGRGNRERVFDDDPLQSLRRGPGRGRGLRRAKMDDYEFRESRATVNKGLPSSFHETTGFAPPSTQKTAPSQPIIKPQEVASKKPTTSSMLKISSPPFFPTGAISQNLPGGATSTTKGSEEKSAERDARQVGRLMNTSRSGMEREMTGFSSSSAVRLPSSPGINTGLAFISNNGEAETGVHRSLARGSSTLQQQLSKTGSGSIVQQQQQIVRAEVSTQRVVDQPSISASQPSSRGAPPATQSLRVQPVSAASQHSGKGASLATQSLRVQQPHQQLQAINQGQISSGQPTQSQTVVSPVSFPAKPSVDLKPAPSPLGSTLASGATGRGTQAATMQAGRGSLVYGTSSLANGLRSVVQFAGQPQAGLGIPAVGMALPGYSSQPQFNFPNSEVTWIPILAGGGSLGSNYSSPYIAVDGGSSAAYYGQQASQASAFPPSSGRELNGSKEATSSSFKPSSRTEPDDLGQQRRRYSQMTFGEERR